MLFVSGYTGDVMSNHGFDSRRESFLEKPFSASQLADKVAAVLAASEELGAVDTTA